MVAHAQQVISSSGTHRLEEMPFWPVITQAMFRDAQGQPDCRDGTWNLLLEIFEAEVMGDGQYWSSNIISNANGELQQRNIPLRVRCLTQSGSSLPTISSVRFIGYDESGERTEHFYLGDQGDIDTYVSKDPPEVIRFDQIQINADGSVSIGLIVDGASPRWSQSQTGPSLAFDWTVDTRTVDNQKFSLQFIIKGEGGQSPPFPANPKTIMLRIPEETTTVSP